jgi:YegS/Rv2252/BmrU family lipid kinase
MLREQEKDYGVKFKVIVNPFAGRGLGARSTPKIRRLLSAQGLNYDLVSTNQTGEAVNLARQAVLDGYDTIVAVGGDGTYHEVINGMLAASEARSSVNGDTIGNLGVLPVGSGCDFAWMVGIPSDLEAACGLLARHRTKVIDMGRVTVDGVPRYFDNTVGIGFDGVVTAECRKIKYLRGMALYLPVVLKTVFASFKPARSTIDYEDDGQLQRLEKTILMATVCNGRREGGGFFIAPQAENDDGIFDLCLADNIPRLQILGMVPHFMRGTHVDKSCVTMIRSKRVVITSADDLIAHADGEMLCTDGHRIECEVLPRQMRVVC